MAKEAYCSYETSMLLKEKGFEQIGCHRQYNTNGVLCNGFCYGPAAPTHQMALAWLRERHIFIEISVAIDLNGNYHYRYFVLDKECKYLRQGWTDFDWKYEDAVEAALKYVLTNYIQP